MFKLIKAVFASGEVLEEIPTLRRKLRNVELDLADLGERFVRLQGRLAKRGELALPKVETAGEPGTDETLDARRQRINDEILRRRGQSRAV